MAMLRVCGHPGCVTLTLGELCLEHEQSQALQAARRPSRAVAALATVPHAQRRAKEGGAQRPGV